MKVFLVAPNFRTMGGFESQLTALAKGLVATGVQVSIFLREPVQPNHPYWRALQAAGVDLHDPAAELAWWFDPLSSWRPGVLSCVLGIAHLPLMLFVLINKLRTGRTWRRSWAGGLGKAHVWLSRVFNWDGLTWWLERRMDWAIIWRQPDLIDTAHSQLPSGITFGHRRGLPTIYTEYGAPSEELWSVWVGLVPVINQADFIICRAEAGLEGLRRLCHANRPAAVVPNAVTLTPTVAADRLLPDGEPVVITSIGRLSPEKGCHYLLAAFKNLVEDNLPVTLVYAGEGPLREGLHAQTVAWGLGDKVCFTGQFDDLSAILRVTHIVAHPTLNDGRSVSVLEAMAWGRPVVATRVGGIPELIEDGVSGRLVRPGDPQALAEALRELVLNPQLRAVMGEAAFHRFSTGNFSVDGMITATLKIYAQVICQARGAQA